MDLNVSPLKTKPHKPVNLRFISLTTELSDDSEQPGQGKTFPLQKSNEVNRRKILQQPLCPVHQPLYRLDKEILRRQTGQQPDTPQERSEASTNPAGDSHSSPELVSKKPLETAGAQEPTATASVPDPAVQKTKILPAR